MCGISGYVLERPLPLDHSLFDRSLSHRGPDGTGRHLITQSEQTIFFAHRRLAIYDTTDSGSQPILSPSSRYLILFNGAIYNFKDLWHSYISTTDKSPDSDTVVLAALIDKLGVHASCDRLNGMFAIAIFDRDLSTLYFFRDRFGQKPLFIIRNPIYNGSLYRGLSFSSEIKLLSAHFQTSHDELYLKDYLVYGKLDSSTHTLYREISRVDPGCLYTFKDETLSKIPYWDFAGRVLTSLTDDASPDDLQEDFQRALCKSISQQVTGDRKLGIMLSSGVDSTVLASLMSRHTSKKIYAFTYDFESNPNGESCIAKQNAERLGLHYIESEPVPMTNLLDNMSSVITQQDEPITSIRTLAQHHIHKTASDHDVRILIEGNGGDESLGAYDHYKASLLVDLLKAHCLSSEDICRRFGSETISIPLLRSIYLQGSCSKDGTESRSVECIQPELIRARETSTYQQLQSFKDIPLSTQIRAQLNDLLSILLPRSLRYVDRSAMHYGNESRAPILDENVVLYGLAYSARNTSFVNRRKPLTDLCPSSLYSIITNAKEKKTIVDPQRDWLFGPLFQQCVDRIFSSEYISPYICLDKAYQTVLSARSMWEAKRIGNSGFLMQLLNLSVLLDPSLKSYHDQ